MSQTNMQMAYQLVLFGLLIGLSVCRPIEDAEYSESEEDQLELSNIAEKFPYFRSMQTLQYYNYDEPSALDRYRMQSYPASHQPNAFRNFGAAESGARNYPDWDPCLQLASERQTLYRQCYFKPITCLRKSILSHIDYYETNRLDSVQLELNSNDQFDSNSNDRVNSNLNVQSALGEKEFGPIFIYLFGLLFSICFIFITLITCYILCQIESNETIV